MSDGSDDDAPELEISIEKVCYIIVKAREWDAKVEPVEPDPGSNPIDDDEREILQDYPDDPTLTELTDAIDGLSVDEAIELIALTWLGRGDFSKEEWADALGLAEDRQRRGASRYLVGMPMLGDLLEEGLAALGYSCEDYVLNRL